MAVFLPLTLICISCCRASDKRQPPQQRLSDCARYTPAPALGVSRSSGILQNNWVGQLPARGPTARAAAHPRLHCLHLLALSAAAATAPHTCTGLPPGHSLPAPPTSPGTEHAMARCRLEDKEIAHIRQNIMKQPHPADAMELLTHQGSTVGVAVADTFTPHKTPAYLQRCMPGSGTVKRMEAGAHDSASAEDISPQPSST